MFTYVYTHIHAGPEKRAVRQALAAARLLPRFLLSNVVYMYKNIYIYM